MAHHLTNAEVENKVAFLVQLHALLTQVSSVVSSNALGSAQKAKLSDIRAATETWLKDVGSVGAPRPSIAPSNPPPQSPVTDAPPLPTAATSTPAESSSPAATAAAAEGEEGTGSTLNANTTTTASAKPSPDPAAPAKESAAAVRPGGSSSFTADMASTRSVTAGRNIVDLVSYLRLLFNNDIPERARLQSFGKNLVRLLMVRCCSTIMASLQHVVYQTYATPPAEPATATTPSAVETDTEGRVEASEVGSPEKNPSSASAPEAPAQSQVQVPTKDKISLFVELAQEINVATKALVDCVQLMTSDAVPSDAASARFPVQLCVDVVKQTRRALLYFQSRLEKEELYLLRNHILSERTVAGTAEAASPLEDVDAAQEVLQQEPAEDVAAHVRSRAGGLEVMWGPSLTHSICHIGDVIEPAVRFLVSVAGVRAEGAPAAMVGLKKDAAHDLFSLCGVASPSATPLPGNGSLRSSATGGGPAASGGLTRPLSSGELHSGANANGAGGNGAVASPVSGSSVMPPAWRAAAGEVLASLGSSYTADYLAAVARCCGENNEGELLSTRLLADMLSYVTTHDVPLLRCVLRLPRWSRPLYEGILNCAVSIQPAVLAAGLDALRLLTVNCATELGQEVGYLYCNVVLRLLESSNSPHYVKRTIVLHLLTTLMSHSSIVPAGAAAEGTRTIPLILHLYRLYDLNVHAHQLNFVQQFTSALSRIVRAAPKEDFAQDAVVQEQLQRQQEAAAAESKKHKEAVRNSTSATTSGNTATTVAAASGNAADGSSLDATAPAASLASLSLPAMALHGLVRIVEVLTTQAPPEEETGRDVLAALPTVQNRERKLKEQQQVDLFNASPKKAVYKMFHVTAEENAIPEEHSAFSAQWDHAHIPPVPSAETAKKVEDVVDFLSGISSLDPAAVAEFLTTPAVFPLHVCTAYLRRLPLSGRSVLEAISELLMRVQLPKEGQRIERLLEYFSAAYFDVNDVPGIDRQVFPFKNDTAVFIVVVATVMLNTNIHNPSVGMRLDLKSFRGQLRRCNDDESFADAFVDDIFYCISTHPLESIKSVTIDTSASADSASRGAFDVFFVSQEEKRQLAFGVERQRMVSETQQLLQLRTRQDPRPSLPPAWWYAAAKDLFLSTWSAVCAVFGPAMYEGPSAPLPVLLQCVRGLQSLLCTAAAFDLQTECTVTLLTLLRMAESTPVRAHCRRAVLVVAATPYAVHFPVRCWVAVCQLMLELRLSSTSEAPPLVEDVFTRMESLTRLSVEADETRTAGEGAETEQESTAAVHKPTEAIHRVLEGVMTTIRGYAVGDVENMSAALVLLRRALEFSRIIHGRRAADVVYYVNIRDFTAVVVPAYVELVKKHGLSDEGLQVLFECLVEILCTMWLASSTRRVVVPASVMSSSGHRSGEGDGARVAEDDLKQPPVTITVDTAPAGFVRCFRCLRSIYDITLASAATDGSATLLQMHTLQAVKEVLSRTAHAAEVTAEAQHLSLYTMVASWQQALYPLAMALCDRRTTTTEAGSLALLVLRKLVALSGGTGGTFSDRLPPQVRGALLWLLAQLSYMGGMCGDVDGAQVCVALLSSICTTTLAMSLSASSPMAWYAAGPPSPPSAASGADLETLARALAERDSLTQRVVSSVEESPEYVVQQTLVRLGLLLRCEREQTRAEVVHQLRTLSLQMRPAQVQTFATDLIEVVLEGAIGHAAHHHKTPITHTSLIPFFFYQMPVPAAMRRCSRAAFRSTLPAALGFLAGELLSGLSGEFQAVTAERVMQRCLMPILLSPNSPYQSRFLAIRSLSQCIAVCLPQNGEVTRPQLAQCVLDCVSLSLYAVQVPLPAIVPPTAVFVGRRWLDAPPAVAAEAWSAYGAAATQTIRVMDTAEPEWVVRGPPAAADATPGVTPATEGGEEKSAGPPPSRGSGGSTTLLADEPLIEYVNLLAQVLAGVPKEVHSVVVSAMARPAGDEQRSEPSVSTAATAAEWALPRTSVLVLLQLTLRAAGTLFSILWRINYPYEVEQYASQFVELGREAPALIRNGGLLPHAAIRSVLQCYCELAMLSVEYPTKEVLASTTDIIEGIRQVQAAAQPSPSSTWSSAAGAYGSGATVPAGTSSLAADPASLQRLSPQEQQHVRTCNSGMYQQLAAVLGYLVKLLTGQSNAVAPAGAAASLTAATVGWAHRKAAFEAMAMHPRFFSSLVSLLTPTAGTLIVSVRDYFAWYIAHAEVLPTSPATPTEEAAPAAIPKKGAPDIVTQHLQASPEELPQEASVNGALRSGIHINGYTSGEHTNADGASASAALKEVAAAADADVEVEADYVDGEDSLL
ncbi:hypothetical protein ABB37_10044 [Leptomonas pyrrhocoris]|uniref:SEC7 domain-containing protein n=1 Tax=Leptomonas pyrrhocoris TaxID=157538 RepID=A0A0N0VCL4_LEPPY|nr:hypothetical protein ABB37_10044 [Leptomonas pyrrhocoris]KPA73221.1 hypothetical protein ABB37_10044 [Leptomonas pyrrhocoris]|eukprot:XP_015651660.1 hypothetical protein ABB37_10044 [Leptomonas pyrrhocoris]